MEFDLRNSNLPVAVANSTSIINRNDAFKF